QDVGILVLVRVDMGQDESTRFDRMFHDREGPSGVSRGELEYNPHSTEPDRTAFVRINDDRRYAHVAASIPFTLRASTPIAVMGSSWYDGGRSRYPQVGGASGHATARFKRVFPLAAIGCARSRGRALSPNG